MLRVYTFAVALIFYAWFHSVTITFSLWVAAELGGNALYAVAIALWPAIGITLLFGTARGLKESENFIVITWTLAAIHALRAIYDVVLPLARIPQTFYEISFAATFFSCLYAAFAVYAVVTKHRAQRKTAPA